MRTTVTIPDELLKKTMKLSGKRRISEALTAAMDEYVQMDARRRLLDRLFNERPPHDYKKIKADRRKGNWVAD